MYDSRFQHLILIWTHRNKQWMRAVWWCLVWIRLELGTVLTRPFLASSIHSSEWKLSTMNWSPLLAHLKNRSAFVILYLSHTSNEPATCLGTLTSHCHGVRSGRWEKIGRTVERCPRSPAVLMRNSCADWHESFQNFKWSQYVCSGPWDGCPQTFIEMQKNEQSTTPRGEGSTLWCSSVQPFTIVTQCAKSGQEAKIMVQAKLIPWFNGKRIQMGTCRTWMLSWKSCPGFCHVLQGSYKCLAFQVITACAECTKQPKTPGFPHCVDDQVKWDLGHFRGWAVAMQ